MKEASKAISPNEPEVLEELCRKFVSDGTQRFVIDYTNTINYGGMHPCGCIVVGPIFAHLLLRAHEQGIDDGIVFFINHEKGHRAHGEFKGRFTAKGLFDTYCFDMSQDKIRVFVRHIESDHCQGEFDYVIPKRSDASRGYLGIQYVAEEYDADLYALEKAEKPIEAISSAIAIIARTAYEEQNVLYRTINELEKLGLTYTDIFVHYYLIGHDLDSLFSGAEKEEMQLQVSRKFNVLGAPGAQSLLRN